MSLQPGWWKDFTGRELDALSGLDPLVPSVVVSAYGDGDRMKRAADLGAEAYVVTPADFKELRVMLESHLGGE